MRKMRNKNERECLKNKEKSEKTKECSIETTPAIVINRDIRIIDVAPSMKTLKDALKEAGLL